MPFGHFECSQGMPRNLDKTAAHHRKRTPRLHIAFCKLLGVPICELTSLQMVQGRFQGFAGRPGTILSILVEAQGVRLPSPQRSKLGSEGAGQTTACRQFVSFCMCRFVSLEPCRIFTAQSRVFPTRSKSGFGCTKGDLGFV